ncbi:MAG: PASTA domain-containing protein [Oscillospiraceae bacterium]
MGIRQIEVQDLENLSAAIAESKLQKDGFKVKKTFEESDDIAKDYVIRTEPGAHEMADQEAPLCWLSAWVPRTPL